MTITTFRQACKMYGNLQKKILISGCSSYAKMSEHEEEGIEEKILEKEEDIIESTVHLKTDGNDTFQNNEETAQEMDSNETEESERKIGFSIAKIMGFETGGEDEAIDNIKTPDDLEKVQEDEKEVEEKEGKMKLWRPKPCREPISQESALEIFKRYGLYAGVGQNPTTLRRSKDEGSSSSISNNPFSNYESMFHMSKLLAATSGAQRHHVSALEMATADEEDKNGTLGGKPKNYPCPECGKVFNAHYNLTRHMPVHTGETLL